MSEEKPPEQPPQPPLDDYGIDHDRLLEIGEKIIGYIHAKYVLDENTPLNMDECYKISQTIRNVWDLTQSILNMDDMLTSTISGMIELQNEDDDNENEGENEDEDDSLDE